MTALTLSPSGFTRRTVLRWSAAFATTLGLGHLLRPAAAQEATPSTDPLRTWTPGQSVTINGADLYYEEHGDPVGQPVLLLHGGLGNTEEFINLTPVLVAAGYRAVAMDCRGHGRSTWGEAPITYERMAADALGLLDVL